jgi:hypothetical protein
MPLDQVLPAMDARSELGSLIAECRQCDTEWDIDLQPAPCCDGLHEWTLQIT